MIIKKKRKGKTKSPLDWQQYITQPSILKAMKSAIFMLFIAFDEEKIR